MIDIYLLLAGINFMFHEWSSYSLHTRGVSPFRDHLRTIAQRKYEMLEILTCLTQPALKIFLAPKRGTHRHNLCDTIGLLSSFNSQLVFAMWLKSNTFINRSLWKWQFRRFQENQYLGLDVRLFCFHNCEFPDSLFWDPRNFDIMVVGDFSKKTSPVLIVAALVCRFCCWCVFDEDTGSR